jgi:hypothetical protein
VRQADQALRIYFMNFLKRTEWHRRPASAVVDEQGCTNGLAALEQLRTRLRTRHYSHRTECTYVDWVRRFIDYAAEQQRVPHPRMASEVVRDYLAHLAMRQHVSASTQNQAFCAILFLCREVLGVDVEILSTGVRAKRGERLPVVLSIPETIALLDAMSGTPRLDGDAHLRRRTAGVGVLRASDQGSRLRPGAGVSPPQQGRQGPVDAAGGNCEG